MHDLPYFSKFTTIKHHALVFKFKDIFDTAGIDLVFGLPQAKEGLHRKISYNIILNKISLCSFNKIKICNRICIFEYSKRKIYFESFFFVSKFSVRTVFDSNKNFGTKFFIRNETLVSNQIFEKEGFETIFRKKITIYRFQSKINKFMIIWNFD